MSQYIEARSEKIPESGCWLWTGSLNRDGYGKAWDGKTITAHRLSYAAEFGAIPDGLCVLHRCDVRCCVNPSHLFLGTNQENTADRVYKNRSDRPKGSRHPLSKLTEEDVVSIRDIFDRAPETKLAPVAARFGVSVATVCEVKKNRHWKHVT